MRLFIVSGLVVAVVTAVAAVRIWQQGDQDEQRPADAIVVLGAAQYDGRPSPVFEARLDHAVQLWQSGHRPTSFVVTGGKLPGDRTTEAAVARKYAIDHGVPPTAIFGEDEAHNTLDSLRAVAAEMKQRGLKSRCSSPIRPTCCGSSGSRTTSASRPTGRRRRTSPVEQRPRSPASATVHELGALAVYFVTGGAPDGGAARELTAAARGDGRATLPGGRSMPRKSPHEIRSNPLA